MNTRYLLAGLAATVLMGGAAQAAVTFTVEAAGQTTTSLHSSNIGVETFTEITPGQYTSQAATFTGLTGVTGTYAGLTPGSAFQVNAQDQYGTDGNYGVTFNGDYGGAASHGYSLTLNKTENYFGVYVEAIDPSNTIQFFNGSTLVGEFDASSLIPTVGNQGAAFVNIFTGASFNTVVFTDTATGTTRGFESDNHTIGSVPEPASWGLMIVGLGLVGGAMRGRRRDIAATA